MKKYIVTVYSHTRSDFVPGKGYIDNIELLYSVERFTADDIAEIKRHIADSVLESWQRDPDALDIEQCEYQEPGDYRLTAGYQSATEDYIEDVYFTVCHAIPCTDLLNA